MSKKRLDVILVERGLADNRSRARALILSGKVFHETQKLDKAGDMVDSSAEITVKQKEHPYVSRGGMKLEKALEHFGVEAKGRSALDVGASTGGFTDCLLRHGAKSVLALDVGKGQLDWKLRNDPRVKVMEKFNARNIMPEKVGGPFDIVTIDVSFISLELILGPVKSVTAPGGVIIALVKPQFEAGREEVSRGGVVKETAVHQRVVEKIASFGQSLGLKFWGHVESPIKGPKGNREFLLAFCKEDY